MDPLTIGALGAYGAGELVKGITGAVGAVGAARAQRRGISRAQGKLKSGYDAATGTLQPFQSTAMGDYNRLSGDVGAGKYDLADPGSYKESEFHWDPNSVFSDPEYKAQMESGTEAINSGAAAKGQTFGGTNLRDLTKYGQNLFADRSDALYGRTRSAHEFDNTMGFNSFNSGFSNKLAARNANYGAARDLAQYGPQSTEALANLQYGYGQGAGNLDINQGNANANGILGTTGAIGNTFSDLGQATSAGLMYKPKEDQTTVLPTTRVP